MSTTPARLRCTSRRTFLQTAAAAAMSTALGPAVHAADKSGNRRPIVGEGAYRYEVEHNWGELPPQIKWGDTHGIAFDEQGLIYITHASGAKEPMDAIVVLDPQTGKTLRSFGKEFHGGGHGLDLRKEGREEFLYLCDVRQHRTAKLSTKGHIVWIAGTPKEPGVYDEKKKYNPTNIAFAPDGGFYVGDGYGSSFVHQYDQDAHWVRTFGGAGREPGKLSCPHGLWLDDRAGREKLLVVADRANSRLQYFTLDGKHHSFVTGLPHPCHFNIRNELLLIPDLHSRVTILDGKNQPVAQLGYDPAWTARVQKDKLRGKPDQWEPGRFVHPHSAKFDRDGNIYVVEWVPVGRVSKLRPVA